MKRIAIAGLVLVFGLGGIIGAGGNPFDVFAEPDAPNPGHSWNEIGDLPGTMWHSNNDGAGSGLDADLLDSMDGAQYRNASNINGGLLSPDFYSAIADLGAEGYLGDAAGDLSQNDGVVQTNLNADMVDGQHGPFAQNDGTLQTNLNADMLDGQHADALSYWSLGGNSAISPSNFLGTRDGMALELKVNNSRAFRLEPTASSPNVVGGYGGNTVSGAVGATIAGGGGSGGWNRVLANFGTVAGGVSNVASGSGSTIGGGGGNGAAGQSATVPGGESNLASGQYSFAAGRGAQATHRGAFVWSDSTGAWGSMRDDQFRVHATGGARFDVNVGRWVEIWDDGTNLINTSTGARLTLGGAWTNASDAALKENFADVDAQTVLANLAEMPITTWNSKAEDDSIRHIGPMAQDFYEAFSLGEDELHITTVDADGVALAAIQGLYELSQEQADRIEALEGRLAALDSSSGAESVAERASSSGLPVTWLLIAGGMAFALAGLALAQGRRR